MKVVEMEIPQMGEGLQEVRIVEFLKKEGDAVEKDEIIYQMETDKAIVDVESAYTGVIKEWLAGEDDILPIEAAIVRIEIEEGGAAASSEASEKKETAKASTPTEAKSQPSSEVPEHIGEKPVRGLLRIPPRTRAYCRDLGISPEEMAQIPAAGNKLMPEDVDAYQKGGGAPASKEAPEASQKATEVEAKPAPAKKTPAPAAPSGDVAYEEKELSKTQKGLVFRFQQSAKLITPMTLAQPITSKQLERRGDALIEQYSILDRSRLSNFQILLYSIAQTINEFPQFRSTFHAGNVVREYPSVNLGCAVNTKDDQLVTAVLPEAGTLELPTFLMRLKEKYETAKEGQDQANESVQFIVSYMGKTGPTFATPVLVAPAVAILFVGSLFTDGNGDEMQNLVLTCNHNLINGLDAAKFLAKLIETIDS